MKICLRLLAISVLVLTVSPIQAGTVKYPAENPLFQFELPDGWSSSPDKDGNLDVKANDKSDYTFSIIPATLSPGQEVKAFMAELAKTMGEGLKNFALDQGRDVTSKTGIKLMVLPAKGKMEDQDMLITLVAFAPVKDKYFILMSMAEQRVDEAHDKPMGQIVNSIKAIE